MMEEMKKMENQHNNHQNNKRCIQPPLDYPWVLFKENQDRTGGYVYSPTSTPYKGFSTGFFPDDLRIRKVYNCCYGWLIISRNPSNPGKDMCLWNPVVSKLIKIPPLHDELMRPRNRIESAVLLSPGKRTEHLDPNCMIMLFVNDRPFYYMENEQHCRIIYLLLGEKRWNSVYYEDKITDLSHPNPIIMNDLVYVEGKVKGGRKKLFCMNRILDKPTGIVLTEYCTLPCSTLYENKEAYLVESCSELFYVVISFDYYLGLILSVETFKFNQVSMKWNRVRDVGDDRLLFIYQGRYSILSRPATSKGCFLYRYVNNNFSYLYNFADNSFSNFSVHSTWKIPDLGFYQSILYLPDTRLIDEPSFQMNLVETGQYEVDARKIKEETKIRKIYDDDKGEKQFRLFCMALFCLPDDLIELIFRILLNPVDYLNFRSASKICRQLAPKIEWRKTLINLTYPPPPISPWMVTFNSHSGTYHFLDSEFGCKYLIRAPKTLNNTKIVHSKNGWLLVMSNSRKETLYFYNPFTTEIIKLPKPPSPNLKDARISFSASPTTSNCLVVALYSDGEKVEIYILQVGKKMWNTLVFSEYYQFHCISCPVFHDGGVYVLDRNGRLLELKFDIDNPSNCACYVLHADHFSKHNFLLECDGQLLAVSVGEGTRGLVKVFVLRKLSSALQNKTLTWEKIDDLGNHSLYLSRTLCFSTKGRAEWMKKKIFFARFHDGHIVLYSMETEKYYTLAANKDHAVEEVEYDDTRDILMSGWIQPSWS